MLFEYKKFSPMLMIGMLAMVAMMSVAHVSNARADDDDDEDTGHRPAVVDAKWASECGGRRSETSATANTAPESP